MKRFFKKFKVCVWFFLSYSKIKFKLSVMFLSRDTRKNKGYKPIFRHGGLGVVISETAYIGKNVIIGQNVTIGEKQGSPTIKDNVIIHPHCIIIGKIVIGENSIIGAGTFINKNIPKNTIVYNKKDLIMVQKK